MQPKRLLQVASLLLLSAAVLGQVDTSAAMPAEIRVAMTFCDNGQVGTQCTWGSRCTLANCVVCQTGAIGAAAGTTVCRYCAAGFFLQNGACTRCPQGAFCGGASPNPTLAVDEATGANVNSLNFRCDWDNGVVTPSAGRWAAVQCTSCTFGWGSFDTGSGTCTACPAGTAKNQILPKECDLCLDGFFANSNLGATDCVNRATLATQVPAFLSENAFCNDFLRGPPATPDTPTTQTRGPTVGATFDAGQNSCICPAGTVTVPPPVQYNAAGNSLVRGLPTCGSCPEGTIFPTGSPAGRTVDDCTRCNPGQRPNTAQTACVPIAG